MEPSELTSLLLIFATISSGAFLGALGNKLVTYNSKTAWKWGFYIFSIISFIGACIYLFIKQDWGILDYVGLIILFISSICLFIFTRIFLDKKTIYRTTELDPIINEFTKLSDHNEIKLFGGDLDFFGSTPSEMDKNNQYNHLKSMSFRRVLILCEDPVDNLTKIRYGKILQEISGVELRFYNPDEADLLIRGRLKTLQGSERLLIYSKLDSGLYQTIETDTANSNGALYSNIWKLVWSLANKTTKKQKDEFLKLFSGR